MAKRVDAAASEMETRNNPDFFGIDVEEVAAGAVGLAATAALNDSFVFPFVSKLMPVTGVAGGLLNAATTFATAIGLDKVLSMFGMRGAGNDAAHGGEILGAARVVSAFAPNLMSIQASFPALSGLGGNITSISSAKSAKAQVTAGSVENTYPRPIAANQNVGL